MFNYTRMKKILEKFKQYKYIIIIGLFVLGFVFYWSQFKQDSKNLISDIQDREGYQIPRLSLPLRYFKSGVTQGTINPNLDSDNTDTWDIAAIAMDAYQSFPTTKITLSSEDYSQKIEPLPPTRSLDQIKIEEPEVWDNYLQLFDEQVKEHGDIATRFLMGDYVTNIEKFDVDLDGKEEIILSTCGTGGNHCPHKVMIIKDGKIIFSIFSYLVLSINKSETGNGFYAHWVPWGKEGTKWDIGLCCSPGYMKTRFVYEDGKFKPVYEQEVLYFEVENTK